MKSNTLKDTVFESDRLITKPLEEEDVKVLFQMYSDHEAMKYRGNSPMKTLEDAHKMVADRWVIQNEIVKHRLGIWEKSNHCLIGTILLTWNQTILDQCEIGFSFGKQYWNKGYGTETLKMIEKQVQTIKSIECITAWSIRANLASVRIFRKAGFVEIKQSEYLKSIHWSKKIIMDM